MTWWSHVIITETNPHDSRFYRCNLRDARNREITGDSRPSLEIEWYTRVSFSARHAKLI